jgi:hypothetical protein
MSDPTLPNPNVPPLTPTFDKAEADGWQAVNVMGPSGHWPSWWSDPTGPEPLIYQSQSQSQSSSQSQRASQSQSQHADSAPESASTTEENLK